MMVKGTKRLSVGSQIVVLDETRLLSNAGSAIPVETVHEAALVTPCRQ